jgi:hypothetical protein
MKRLVLAALAASVLGGGAASAMPILHPVHGPIFHGPIYHGPIHHGPIYGGPIFHPGPIGPGPLWPASFHRWGYGEFLPRALFAPAAYVVDYPAHELGAPPADCEWVRNGPDALLVNLDTGMVIQVVPGAFA